MKFSVAIVTALVCASNTLAVNTFDIPLQRRSFHLNVNETNTREIDTYVSNLAAKYNNALQNYKKNTGK